MGRLSFLFARKYLFSKKSHSVINIISGVSAVAVGVPVAAMIILLSVFNGFELLVKDMFTDFDPDIMVLPASGKTIGSDDLLRDNLLDHPNIIAVSDILEDNALLEYRGRQYIGIVRGVDGSYGEVIPIDNIISQGVYEPMFGDIPQALIGEGIAYSLGIRTALHDPISVLVPRRGRVNPLLPLDSYREGMVYPSGIFRLDAETDSKYIIAPIEFARDVFGYPHAVSGIAVKLAAGTDPDKMKKEISGISGPEYTAKTRYEQKEGLYRIMKYEKWGIFLIITLVMIIASFSIIGTTVMMIIEKRKENKTLRSLGADNRFIRRIFLDEGMLISYTGGAFGLVAGLIFCYIQIRYGIITIPADTFLIDSYPVKVKLTDIGIVSLAFIAINYLIVNFTVARMLPANKEK